MSAINKVAQVLSCVFLASMSSLTFGSPAGIEISVSGMGTESCLHLSEAIAKEPDLRYRSYSDGTGDLYPPATVFAEWLSGYAAGYQFASRRYVGAAMDALAYEVKIYCDAHPADTVDTAANVTLLRLSRTH